MTIPDVPTGTWTVLVEALDTDTDPAVVVGRSDGSDTVSVSPGGTAPVSVTVSPTAVDAGAVEVQITWPETADVEGVQSATWTRISDSSASEIASSFVPTALGNGSIFSSLSEPSGEYRLVVRLENAAAVHVATVISAVHIYDNVTTAGSIHLTIGEIAQPPLPPKGLTAVESLDVNGTVELAWVDESNVEEGYTVERSSDGGGTWSPIASLSANAISYADTGLLPGTSYQYRVVAENTFGEVTTDSVTIATRTLSTVATLSDLRVNGFTITGFDSGTPNYTTTVSTASTTVGVTTSDSNATVAGPTSPVTLAYGTNTFTWTVTAEDGVTEEVYTVTIERPAAAASSPAPADGDVDIVPDSFFFLGWSDAVGATTYDVYLAEQGSALPATPTTSGTSTSSVGYSLIQTNFGTLASGTTYQWRVDSVVGGIVTTGTVWTFTTEVPPGTVSGTIGVDDTALTLVPMDFSVYLVQNFGGTFPTQAALDGALALDPNGANDTTADAIAISADLSAGYETEEYLVPGDTDIYAVDLTGGDNLLAYTTYRGGLETDTYLRLLDGSGTPVTENDDDSNDGSFFSRIEYTVATGGTYYLEVTGFSDSEFGGYTLGLQTYPDPQTPPTVTRVAGTALNDNVLRLPPDTTYELATPLYSPPDPMYLIVETSDLIGHEWRINGVAPPQYIADDPQDPMSSQTAPFTVSPNDPAWLAYSPQRGEYAVFVDGLLSLGNQSVSVFAEDPSGGESVTGSVSIRLIGDSGMVSETPLN